MRFIELLAKQDRPRAWYALGLSVVQRYLLAIGGGLATVAVADPGDPTLNRSLLGGLLVVIAVAVFFVPDRVLRHYRARWVDALELPLDRERYADALNGNARHARLRVVIEGDALRMPELHGVAVTAIEDTPVRLILESSTMQLRSPYAKEPGHNLELHRWFVLLTDHVLRPLATSQRIRRIITEQIEVSP